MKGSFVSGDATLFQTVLCATLHPMQHFQFGTVGYTLAAICWWHQCVSDDVLLTFNYATHIVDRLSIVTTKCQWRTNIVQNLSSQGLWPLPKGKRLNRLPIITLFFFFFLKRRNYTYIHNRLPRLLQLAVVKLLLKRTQLNALNSNLFTSTISFFSTLTNMETKCISVCVKCETKRPPL